MAPTYTFMDSGYLLFQWGTRARIRSLAHSLATLCECVGDCLCIHSRPIQAVAKRALVCERKEQSTIGRRGLACFFNLFFSHTLYNNNLFFRFTFEQTHSRPWKCCYCIMYCIGRAFACSRAAFALFLMWLDECALIFILCVTDLHIYLLIHEIIKKAKIPHAIIIVLYDKHKSLIVISNMNRMQCLWHGRIVRCVASQYLAIFWSLVNFT